MMVLSSYMPSYIDGLLRLREYRYSSMVPIDMHNRYSIITRAYRYR